MLLESERPDPGYVLDSLAILAYLGDEPGGERVTQLLERAAAGQNRLFLSVVNLGEVIYIVERERGLPAVPQVLARLDELPITVVDADRALTLAAAHFKAQLPIAYADCFALALARERRLSLLTGDPELGQAQGLVDIEWLPREGGEDSG